MEVEHGPMDEQNILYKQRVNSTSRWVAGRVTVGKHKSPFLEQGLQPGPIIHHPVLQGLDRNMIYHDIPNIYSKLMTKMRSLTTNHHNLLLQGMGYPIRSFNHGPFNLFVPTAGRDHFSPM